MSYYAKGDCTDCAYYYRDPDEDDITCCHYTDTRWPAPCEYEIEDDYDEAYDEYEYEED